MITWSAEILKKLDGIPSWDFFKEFSQKDLEELVLQDLIQVEEWGYLTLTKKGRLYVETFQ